MKRQRSPTRKLLGPAAAALRRNVFRDARQSEVQVTTEDILRDAVNMQQFHAPNGKSNGSARVMIYNKAELALYRQKRRAELEEKVKRGYSFLGNWMKYARWEAQQKDFTRMRIILQRAIENHGENPKFWRDYADLEAQYGFIQQAREVYHRAVSVLPLSADLWFKYLIFEQAAGQDVNTRDVFNRWISSGVPPACAYEAYALFETQRGNRAACQDVLRRYVEAFNTPDSWLLFAHAEQCVFGDVGRAIKILHTAFQALPEEFLWGPKECRVPMALAEMLADKGQINDARTAYRNLLHHLHARSAADGAIQNDLIDTVLTAYSRFERLHGDRQNCEALSRIMASHFYKKRLEKDPQDFDARLSLYLVLREEEREEAARCDGGVRLLPDGGAPKHASHAKERPAMQCLLEATRVNATSPGCAQQRAVLIMEYARRAEENGQMDIAQQALAKGIKEFPFEEAACPRLWLEAAAFEERRGDYASARKLLSAAAHVTNDPAIFNASLQMEQHALDKGVFATRADYLARVRAIYRDALRSFPTHEALWFGFAKMEEKEGQVATAHALYSACAKTLTAEAASTQSYARRYTLLGDVDRAWARRIAMQARLVQRLRGVVNSEEHLAPQPHSEGDGHNELLQVAQRDLHKIYTDLLDSVWADYVYEAVAWKRRYEKEAAAPTGNEAAGEDTPNALTRPPETLPDILGPAKARWSEAAAAVKNFLFREEEASSALPATPHEADSTTTRRHRQAVIIRDIFRSMVAKQRSVLKHALGHTDLAGFDLSENIQRWVNLLLSPLLQEWGAFETLEGGAVASLKEHAAYEMERVHTTVENASIYLPGSSLMGSLRCLYEGHSRNKILPYKKKFWVVNDVLNRLEMYKNDQTYVPQSVVKAQDITNVIYTGSKQNRFYMMIVKTRKHQDIRFRMNSSEEREKWYAAITKLVDAYSTTNRCISVLGMVLRQCRMMSHWLKVDILINAARLSSDIPSDFFQYLLEAVDAAILNITVIVRTYGSEILVPRSYTLSVHACSTSHRPIHTGPQYDPTKRSVVLHVCLYRDAKNHVQFDVTEADEVLRLLQSNVFRNPLVEGWIDVTSGCAAVCSAIREDLQAKKSFAITFQWGQNLTDSDNVEAYLEKFVQKNFFQDIRDTISGAIIDIEEFLKDQFTTNSVLSQPASPMVMPLTPSPLLQQTVTRPFNKSVAHASTHGRPGGTDANALLAASGVFGSSGHLPLTELHSYATRLVSDHLAGLAILLQKSIVMDCTKPPPVLAEQTLEYEQKCRPAFLLSSKYRQAFLQPAIASPRSRLLKEQLSDIAFHALLQRQITALRAQMNAVFDKRITILIAWEQLLRSLAEIGTGLSLHDLPRLVESVARYFLPRVQYTAHMLFQCKLSTGTSLNAEGGGADGSLYDVFCRCVNVLRFNFIAFAHESTWTRMPEPMLNNGVLEDTWVCVEKSQIPNLLAIVEKTKLSYQMPPPWSPLPSLHRTQPGQPLHLCPDSFSFSPTRMAAASHSSTTAPFGGGGDARQIATLLFNACVFVPTAKLGTWCKAYFSVPSHCTLNAKDAVSDIKDEFGSDSDTSTTVDPVLKLEHDDAVANERSAEIQVLNMKRVVNAVYDSQGKSFDFKIGAQEIRKAIHSLTAAFGSRRIMKHDLSRVLVENLRRLCNMYTRTIKEETNSFLNEEDAETLLRDFCEYEENERDILHLLRSAQAYYNKSVSTISRVHLIGATEYVNNADIPNHVDVGTVGREGMFSQTVETDSLQQHHTQPLPHKERHYDYPTICHVALNYLLPREAVVARKAWRIGFVFGLENVGKSLIINCMCGIARQTVATVGLSCQVFSFAQWVFAMRELGGRESFRKNWKFYCKRMDEVNFLLYVVDSMNHRAHKDAHHYLREVADHYHDIPLLMVFNNYRDMPRKITPEELEDHIMLSKIRDAHPHRTVIVAVANITVVHSFFRAIPASLKAALEKLSTVLLERSPADRLPSVPKDAFLNQPSPLNV